MNRIVKRKGTDMSAGRCSKSPLLNGMNSMIRQKKAESGEGYDRFKSGQKCPHLVCQTVQQTQSSLNPKKSDGENSDKIRI